MNKDPPGCQRTSYGLYDRNHHQKTGKQCVQKSKVLFFTKISERLTFFKQSLRENQGLNFAFPSSEIIYKNRKLNPKIIYTF